MHILFRERNVWNNYDLLYHAVCVTNRPTYNLQLQSRSQM